MGRTYKRIQVGEADYLSSFPLSGHHGIINRKQRLRFSEGDGRGFLLPEPTAVVIFPV